MLRSMPLQAELEYIFVYFLLFVGINVGLPSVKGSGNNITLDLVIFACSDLIFSITSSSEVGTCASHR